MKRLGDIVQERGWMTGEQVQECLQQYESSGMKLGSYLLYRKLLTREQLGLALSEQYEVPYAHLGNVKVHLNWFVCYPSRSCGVAVWFQWTFRVDN